MRILIDTNILLEGILAQKKADEAKALLEKTEKHDFFISDYTLHSIGLLLFRRKQHNVFRQFLTDMIFIAGKRMIILSAEDMEVVINASQRFKIDFDDAYQYVAAEKYNLTIVSFDTDFDRTDRGRKTPAQILS